MEKNRIGPKGIGMGKNSPTAATVLAADAKFAESPRTADPAETRQQQRPAVEFAVLVTPTATDTHLAATATVGFASASARRAHVEHSSKHGRSSS